MTAARGAGLEAAGLFALILLEVWLVEPHVRGAWLALPVLAAVSHVRRGETPAALGFGRANLRPCLAAVMPLLLGIAAVALALGLAFGTVRRPPPGELALFVAYYCVWGLFQQYALNAYFVNRFAAAAPPGRAMRRAPLLAAGCFALVHAPNWFLVAVTFGAGLLCARLYLRHRNLYPLGLAHGLLGSVLFLTVPDAVAGHFYIGPRALRWQREQEARTTRRVTFVRDPGGGAGGDRPRSAHPHRLWTASPPGVNLDRAPRGG